jgi:hypothetical protein
MRTPIFCLISIPKSFIFPTFVNASALCSVYSECQEHTYFNPFLLNTAKILQLLSVEMALGFSGRAFVFALVRSHVRFEVICVISRRHKLAGSKGTHPTFVSFDIVELLVREGSCIMYISVELCGVIN